MPNASWFTMCMICFLGLEKVIILTIMFKWTEPWRQGIGCEYYEDKWWAKTAKYHIFWKFLAKKHCFGNKWESTTFPRTLVPHQFCHCGTAELEFVRLKKIMWYSSLVDSSTMQHNTRIYQARVPFINKMQKILFLRYSSLPNSSTM